MSVLIKNIHLLVGARNESQVLRGAELAELPVLQHAFLEIENGLIKAFGAMNELDPTHSKQVNTIIDAKGASILPAWCDSHTHLVFAASREEEFVDKLKGMGYAEIAAKGGGILNSARKLQNTSEEALFQSAWTRLQELMKLGTGAIEIKSGYGLSLEGELKMLRVIKRLKTVAPIPIKTSFLGAHAFPEQFVDDHYGYINLIIEKMLPAIAAEKLADYIDVFCEEGFFNTQETETICRAGLQYGLKAKIHANQFNTSGGTQTGVKLGAVSVDHLETMDEAAIDALSGSNTMGTLLTTASYFLRLHYPPARTMLQKNCIIALASDFNPGSSPSGNMNQVVSMACIQMKLLPEEAINAATLNGAYAMELGDQMGSITPGKRANLIFTQPIPSIAYLPYAFGSNLIEKVMLNGVFI